MNKIIKTALVFLLVVAAGGAEEAVPPAESMYFLLNFYAGIVNELDRRNAVSQESGRAFFRGALATLNIDERDFKPLGRAVEEVRTDLAQLQVEVDRYLAMSKRNGISPESSILAEFEARRQHILDEARGRIRAKVSSNSWSSLETYMIKISKSVSRRTIR